VTFEGFPQLRDGNRWRVNLHIRSEVLSTACTQQPVSQTQKGRAESGLQLLPSAEQAQIPHEEDCFGAKQSHAEPLCCLLEQQPGAASAQNGVQVCAELRIRRCKQRVRMFGGHRCHGRVTRDRTAWELDQRLGHREQSEITLDQFCLSRRRKHAHERQRPETPAPSSARNIRAFRDVTAGLMATVKVRPINVLGLRHYAMS